MSSLREKQNYDEQKRVLQAAQFCAAGQIDKGRELYLDITQKNPQNSDALFALGMIARLTETDAAAKLLIERALKIEEKPIYYLTLSEILLADNEPKKAEILCRRAIDLDPNFAESYWHLGSALHDQGDYSAAEKLARKTLELNPESADGMVNLGRALLDQDRLDEAIQASRRAIELRPGFASAHNNLGIALMRQKNYTAADQAFRDALAAQPDFASPHWNYTLSLLLQGRWIEAWEHYEWRWKVKSLRLVERHFVQPLWRGETLKSKTILLHAEQGFGDTIQFARYAKCIIDQGGAVILEVQPSLRTLMSTMTGLSRVISADGDEPMPAFDCHCPLLSLPRVMGTSIATIPAVIPYLWPSLSRIGHWQQMFESTQGTKVGLVWRGNPAHRKDIARSIPATELKPLFTVDGLNLFSLQLPSDLEEIRMLRNYGPIEDLAPAFHDWMETAAAISALDLVISVDTAVAHLAGALGKPVWLVLPFSSEWRWLQDRSDSPWYSSMRIFRQHQFNDWRHPIQEIVKALRSR